MRHGLIDGAQGRPKTFGALIRALVLSVSSGVTDLLLYILRLPGTATGGVSNQRPTSQCNLLLVRISGTPR